MKRILGVGVIALALLILAVAIAFDKRGIAIGICVLAALPVLIAIALRNPILFPFGLYAVLVPFDPLLQAQGGTGGTLTRFVGIALIGALLLRALRLRRLSAPPHSWLFWAAFVTWCLATQMWSIDPTETARELGIIGSLFALYTVACVYPISPLEYLTARRAVIVAGLLTAAYGIFAFAQGQRLGARLALQSGRLQIDPNHYAAFFAIPICLLTARVFFTTSGRERVLAMLLVVPMFANVLLTGSRGGLIAVAIGVAIIGLRAKRFAILGAMFASAFAASFAIPTVWERFGDPTQGDASGRAEIWAVGIKTIAHFGFVGSGFGTFPDAYNLYLVEAVQRQFAGWDRPAHDVLIQTTTELGVVGLALLLAAWWQSLRQNAKLARGSVFFPDRVAYEGALAATFVNALSIDLLWFKYLWLCLMLVVMLANALSPRTLWGRAPGRSSWQAPLARRPRAWSVRPE